MLPFAERAQWRPLVRPFAGGAGTVHFACQETTPPGCYGPDQIRAAYRVQPLLDRGYDGAGRTIAIIEAFGSPSIDADLSAFDGLWGLPAPPSFQHVAPFGIDSTDVETALAWAGETSLDVEWAHAIAPGADIVVVVAKSDSDADLLAATQWVLDHGSGDIVVQTYGEAEQCMDGRMMTAQHRLFGRMTREGITLVAASGDQGSGQFTCDGSDYFKAVATPASDPNVTAVGGTILNADGASGAYLSETTWNESSAIGDAEAGGGGVSVVYTKPRYQKRAQEERMRTLPDVSYTASLLSGVVVVYGGSPYSFGGTSVGTPQWAGLFALTAQLANERLGNVNDVLYRLAAGRQKKYFRDVRDGSTNALPDLGCCGTPIDGYVALRGYDLATGLGSPIASALVPALARDGQFDRH